MSPITEDFLREFRPTAIAIAMKSLHNVEDAEDVVQIAYLKAWNARDRFEARSSAQTWMHRIIHNAAIESIRRRAARGMDRQVELPANLKGSTDIERELIYRDLLERVERSVAGMSQSRQRGFDLAIEQERGLCSSDKIRKLRVRAALRRSCRKWIN